MWGLAISAATVIASSILSSDNKDDTSCESRDARVRQEVFTIAEERSYAAAEYREPAQSAASNETTGSNSLALRRDLIFLSGTLLGSGMVIFLTALSNHYRVHQRARHWTRKVWYIVIEQKRLADVLPFRIPAPPQTSKEILQHDDGTTQVLVSPQTAPTSQLHVSLITLKPGAELPMHATHAVEFYQVLQGSGGTFSQLGMRQELPINRGDCFVVDPDTPRWIRAGNSEPLVLLRSSDGGRTARESFLLQESGGSMIAKEHQRTGALPPSAPYEALHRVPAQRQIEAAS